MKKVKSFACAVGITASFFGMEVLLKLLGIAGIAIVVMVTQKSQMSFSNAIDWANEINTRYNNFGYCLTVIVSLLLFLLLFARDRRKIQSEMKENPMNGRTVSLLLLFGLFCAVAVNAIIAFLMQADASSEASTDRTPVETVFYLIGLVIIAPLAEELIFRGVLFRRLKDSVPVAAAIILSSVTFGLIHGGVASFVYSFMMGVFFALVYQSTNTLIAAILLHITYNLVSVLLAMVPFPKAGTIAAAVVGILGMGFMARSLFRKRRTM